MMLMLHQITSIMSLQELHLYFISFKISFKRVM